MENYRKFSKILNEAMPCDGCIHNEQCTSKKQACFAFTHYVLTGKDNWTLPRAPSKMTYALTMNDDNSLKIQVNQKLKELA